MSITIKSCPHCGRKVLWDDNNFYCICTMKILRPHDWGPAQISPFAEDGIRYECKRCGIFTYNNNESLTTCRRYVQEEGRLVLWDDDEIGFDPHTSPVTM